MSHFLHVVEVVLVKNPTAIRELHAILAWQCVSSLASDISGYCLANSILKSANSLWS